MARAHPGDRPGYNCLQFHRTYIMNLVLFLPPLHEEEDFELNAGQSR